MLSKEEVKKYMDSMYETISNLNKNEVEDINAIIRDYKNDYPINPIPYIFWVAKNNTSKYSTFFTPAENVFTFEIERNVVMLIELKEPSKVTDSNSKRVLNKLQSNISYTLREAEYGCNEDKKYKSDVIFKKFSDALTDYLIQRRGTPYLMSFLSAMIDKSNWNISIFDLNKYTNNQIAYYKKCNMVRSMFEGTDFEETYPLYKIAFYFWATQKYTIKEILPLGKQLDYAVAGFKQLFPNEDYTYIKAKVAFKDDIENVMSVRFELSLELNEKYDEQIFFYCENLKEFFEIANDSYTDFYIVEIEEVGNDK